MSKHKKMCTEKLSKGFIWTNNWHKSGRGTGVRNRVLRQPKYLIVYSACTVYRILFQGIQRFRFLFSCGQARQDAGQNKPECENLCNSLLVRTRYGPYEGQLLAHTVGFRLLCSFDLFWPFCCLLATLVTLEKTS